MRKLLSRMAFSIVRRLEDNDARLRLDVPEMTDEEFAMLKKINGLSMTEPEVQWSFLQVVRHIERNNIPGDIVECGVWRGGYLALAGMMRDKMGFDREIWGYDTYAGMTAPTEFDTKSKENLSVDKKFDQLQRGDHNEWCYASLEDVSDNFFKLVKNGGFRPIVGPVQETLIVEDNLPKQIAILRLDTDFYDSTKIELEKLWGRVSPGGVMMVDDYGEWKGSRKAVDEFFADKPLFLIRLNRPVRLAFKPV